MMAAGDLLRFEQCAYIAAAGIRFPGSDAAQARLAPPLLKPHRASTS
jgi:hypothetical protein